MLTQSRELVVDMVHSEDVRVQPTCPTAGHVMVQQLVKQIPLVALGRVAIAFQQCVHVRAARPRDWRADPISQHQLERPQGKNNQPLDSCLVENLKANAFEWLRIYKFDFQLRMSVDSQIRNEELDGDNNEEGHRDAL